MWLGGTHAGATAAAQPNSRGAMGGGKGRKQSGQEEQHVQIRESRLRCWGDLGAQCAGEGRRSAAARDLGAQEVVWI